MTRYPLLLTFLIFCTTSIHCNEKTPRILELIPESWIEYPAVEPALPPNYTMRIFDEMDCILWGTKDDLSVFEDPESNIKSEVIALTHSWSVIQTSPTSLSIEKMLNQVVQQSGMRYVKTEKYMWGKYPVFAIDGIGPGGMEVHIAWVGLNSPQGMTMQMCLFLPKSKNGACPVWKTLLRKTKALSEAEFFRAMGMDMQDGYTLYRSGPASVKVTAEKRISDNLLAVKIEPTSDNTTFTINEVDEGFMASDWKFGHPCTKVFGVMNGNDNLIVDSVVTVLTKEVENFSFDLNEENHPDEVVIYKKPI